MSGADRVVAHRYHLRERLGSGGMGTVWRGEDLVLGRPVAVKEIVFPPGVSEQEREILRERTRREARAAAQLDHPGVVTVHDVVEEGSATYLVMEHVPASTLSDVVSGQGPLSPRRTAEVGLAVLAALRAAHARGIVHRDVKPSNVLLCQGEGGAPGRVVLTDFGIASSPGDSRLTSSGLVLGSPGYIAPERARGEPPVPDSDLWSLGATLFTAVEGHPPFDAGDPMATLTAVLFGKPAPYARAGPLEPVITGLLERELAQRMSAAEAEAALRAVATSPASSTAAAVPVPPAAVEPGAAAGTAVLQLPAVLPVEGQIVPTQDTGEPVESAPGLPPGTPGNTLSRSRLPSRRPVRPRRRRVALAVLVTAAALGLALPVVRDALQEPPGGPGPAAADPSQPPGLPALSDGLTPDEQLATTVRGLADRATRDPDALGTATTQVLSGLRGVQSASGPARRAAAMSVATSTDAAVTAGTFEPGAGRQVQAVLEDIAAPPRLVDLIEALDVDRSAVGPGGPRLFQPLFDLDHRIPGDRTATAAAAVLRSIQDGVAAGQVSEAFAAAAAPKLRQLADPAAYRSLEALVRDVERNSSAVGPGRRQVLTSLRQIAAQPVFDQGESARALLELLDDEQQVTPTFRDTATPVVRALIR